jgi:NADPH-dependent curcumin reductase CurA
MVQIVYAQPPADGAQTDTAGTINVVDTPFDTEATSLESGEVLVENQYLSIDPYHRFGLYDPADTRTQFPVTKPGTIMFVSATTGAVGRLTSQKGWRTCQQRSTACSRVRASVRP